MAEVKIANAVFTYLNLDILAVLIDSELQELILKVQVGPLYISRRSSGRKGIKCVVTDMMN